MQISYNSDTDVVEINGVKYKGSMFPDNPEVFMGSLFTVVPAQDGSQALQLVTVGSLRPLLGDDDPEPDNQAKVRPITDSGLEKVA